jgi:O-antigen/teichoic acid export membrane protein
MLVAMRSIVTQAIGLAGIVLLTKELSPHQFGLIAFGLAITAFASAFADVGLAAGLIRSPSTPTRGELQAALGLQVITMTFLALVLSLAALPFGVPGKITALMLLSLPVAAWQTPPRVLLERSLDYKTLSAVELGQSVGYWATAITAVACGLGVWGVAAASVVQTGVGTALLLWRVPEARLKARLSWRESRSLAEFGAAFQAVNFTNLVRDQGLNLAVAAILGISGLGVWNVAARVLRAPLTLFGAVWRVSYPSMAHIVRGDPRPAALLERAVAVSALGCGLLLAPLGGVGVVLVPLVFGQQWRGAGYVLAPASAALMLGGPVSLAVGGYLYAIGAVRTVLWSAVLHTAAWFAISLPLLPLIGVTAIGVGWIAGAAVDAVVLAKGARREAGAEVLGPILGPLVVAFAAGGAAFAIATSRPATPLLAILALTLALALYVGILGISGFLFPKSRVGAGVRLATSLVLARPLRGLKVHPTLDAHVAP